MPQSLTAKRLRVAGAAVSGATALYDAESGLKAAAAERAESGSFTDAELQAESGLAHLTAFLVGLVLDSLVPDIEAFLDGKVSNNASNPTRRSVLLQMRR